MNKIYNNLTIDNLMKTNWFNQFGTLQQKEIIEGYNKKLDISWYAKPEIDWWQMRKIRTSLEKKKINVFIYAKLTYFLNKIKLKLFKKSTLK